MEKYYEILEKCPLFAGIAREDMERMLTCLDARVASFDKKYTVFAEGTPAKYVGIVLEGSVRTAKPERALRILRLLPESPVRKSWNGTPSVV